MAFITTGSGVCLAEGGSTVFPGCGPIIEEGGLKYVFTEAEGKILLDGECGASIPSFNCFRDPGKMVDSGKSVILSNTCTLPITITGFTNSDPKHFSIFKFPEYYGYSRYESGNTSELPLTIEPFNTITIPTFFHPTEAELTTGTPGTFDNRIGDSFGATVDIHPGFPVLNCSSSSTDCDASFILSGELICDTMDLPDWLSNSANFTTPDLNSLGIIENTPCIAATGAAMIKSASSPGTAGFYSELKVAAQSFKFLLDNSPSYTSEPRAGWSGALGIFDKLVGDMLVAGAPYDLSNLINQTRENYLVNSVNKQRDTVTVSGSYNGPNTGQATIITPDGISALATGLNMSISGGANFSYYYPPGDSTLFFGEYFLDGESSVFVFVSDSGDFNTTSFCTN